MGEIYWQVHFCADCLSSNVGVCNKYLPLSCAEAGLSHDPGTTELPALLLHFNTGVTEHLSEKSSGKLLMTQTNIFRKNSEMKAYCHSQLL